MVPLGAVRRVSFGTNAGLCRSALMGERVSRPPHSTALPPLRGNKHRALDAICGSPESRLMPNLMPAPVHLAATNAQERSCLVADDRRCLISASREVSDDLFDSPVRVDDCYRRRSPWRFPALLHPLQHKRLIARGNCCSERIMLIDWSQPQSDAPNQEVQIAKMTPFALPPKLLNCCRFLCGQLPITSMKGSAFARGCLSKLPVATAAT